MENLKTKYSFLATIIIILLAMFSCGNIAPGGQIQDWITKGALIVDVRTPQEFKTGNYPGSVNIPLADIEKRIAEFGPKNGYIIIYCRSGNRSGKAKIFLESQGYKNIINGGGLQNLLKETGHL